MDATGRTCNIDGENTIERSVWIFARPIRFATMLGFQFVSHGTYPFCHWGVLVTPLNFDTMKALLTEPTQSTSMEDEDHILGDMWRLSLREEKDNPVDVIRPFKLSNAREEWNLFSTECVGKTKKTDQEIEKEGTIQLMRLTKETALKIIEEKPGYNLFENNCQNFTKYLVDAISPGSFRTEMVKTILDRFIASDTPAKLPSHMVSASLGFGFFFNVSENTISPIPSPMTEHFPFHSPGSRFESPLQGIVLWRI